MFAKKIKRSVFVKNCTILILFEWKKTELFVNGVRMRQVVGKSDMQNYTKKRVLNIWLKNVQCSVHLTVHLIFFIIFICARGIYVVKINLHSYILHGAVRCRIVGNSDVHSYTRKNAPSVYCVCV